MVFVGGGVYDAPKNGGSNVSLRLGPLAVLIKLCRNYREWQSHSHGGGNVTNDTHKFNAASVIHCRSCRFATPALRSRTEVELTL